MSAPDVRLHFVRNLDALSATPPPASETSEYELWSDTELGGRMAHGPYELFSLEGPASAGRVRRLCLRIRHAEAPSSHASPPDTRRNGFHHGGYAHHEIVALASLALRRRLALHAVARRG